MIEPIRLRVGDSLSRDELLKKFEIIRYGSVEMVAEPGEYAIHGANVDVYPISYRAPIRIHFHLDQIESIRDYSLQEGKSLTTFEELFLLPLTETFLKKRERLRESLEEFEPVAGLEDIRPGDFVVHLEYGVGRFLGTKTLKLQGESKKHIAIEYADREILYLPFDHHQLLERYLGLD